MKLFADANILVAVINREYPAFDSCSRILSLADTKGYEIYCSSLSLGIAFYFAEKKHGRKEASRRVNLICKHVSISPCSEAEVKLALMLKDADFEDALQDSSAISAGCDAIITLNHTDFWFSKLNIWHPEDFLLRKAAGIKQF